MATTMLFWLEAEQLTFVIWVLSSLQADSMDPETENLFIFNIYQWMRAEIANLKDSFKPGHDDEGNIATSACLFRAATVAQALVMQLNSLHVL